MAKNEPVLLVGETGVGKTATINYLAQLAGMGVGVGVACLVGGEDCHHQLSSTACRYTEGWVWCGCGLL